MCGFSKGDVISQLIIVAESKSGIVAVTVNVVRIDSVAAFLSSLFHADFHDGHQDIEFSYIQPSFPRPAVKISA